MTPLRQQLIDLINAVDSIPGRRRLLLCGRSIYEQITEDDIEWLMQEHNCEILPPMEQPSQTQTLPPFCHVFGRGRRRVSILRPRP